jgi:hypothetical protein
MRKPLIFLLISFLGMSCSNQSTGTDENDSAQEYIVEAPSMSEIISPPSDSYKPIATVDGDVKDVSFMGTKRLRCNLNFKKKEPREVAEKEIRYWLHKIYSQNPDAKAIDVSCFAPNESFRFMGGVLAPFGDWTRANESVGIGDYKVKID